MIKTTEEIMKTPYKYTENKEWVSIDDLMKAIAFVNKKLYDDEFGSYDWNELLLEYLEEGVDEE